MIRLPGTWCVVVLVETGRQAAVWATSPTTPYCRPLYLSYGLSLYLVPHLTV